MSSELWGARRYRRLRPAGVCLAGVLSFTAPCVAGPAAATDEPSRAAAALSTPAGPELVHLWAAGAPGFEDRKAEPEQARDWWVRNIQAARFLNGLGVAAFALKYRLPNAEGSPYTMQHPELDARGWPERMADWLRDSGYLERGAAPGGSKP